MKYQKIKSIILQQVQRRIENLAEHLRWSVFRKQLTVLRHELFLKNALS